MGFYFYALKGSLELLGGTRQKAFLVGSDFGYGNFGDVLQHVSAVSFVHDNSSLAVVAVNSIATIPKFADIRGSQDAYGVDCLLYVSEAPLSDDWCKSLGLEQVTSLNNVAYVQLYGGGFLNELWGEYVLAVAEAFLHYLDNAVYVISGQQVSEGFVDRVVAHIQKFKPVFVGVRDYQSEQLLKLAGVDAEFSFDDAVEPLLRLRELLQVEVGPGMMVHLNTSDYTGNDAAMSDIKTELTAMSSTFSDPVPVTLLQAYRDQREEVVDSIESIKRLGPGFGFSDLRLIHLLNLLEAPRSCKSLLPLVGEFAYSCSYHITLWMQLSGIPCWLRGENAYYRQKREALGLTFNSFSEFLEQRTVPDHSQKLQRRLNWLDKVKRVLTDLGPVSNSIAFSLPAQDCALLNFRYKGEPSLSERLTFAWSEKLRADELLEREKARASSSTLRVAELERENQVLLERCQVMGARISELEGYSEDFRVRKLALIERITRLGHDFHKVQSDRNWIQSELGRVNEENARLRAEVAQRRDAQVAAESQINLLYQSTSWRLARPVRVLVRYYRTRRFDAAGNVGLFEALRRVARKLRVPAKVRSFLGRKLEVCRR